MTGPVRAMRKDDIEAATHVFFDAVHDAENTLYNEIQRAAWAPLIPDAQKWQKRLVDQHGFVIEDDQGLAGFMTMTREGMIDLAFIRPDCQRKGVGSSLYAAIEACALEHKIRQLATNASKMARPFFEKHGWHVVDEHVIERSNVTLPNYRMAKNLTRQTGSQRSMA